MVAQKTNGTPQWRLESENARSRVHCITVPTEANNSHMHQVLALKSLVSTRDRVLGYRPTRWESEGALKETRGRGIAVAA